MKRTSKHIPIHFVSGEKTVCGVTVDSLPTMLAIPCDWKKATCMNCLRTRKWQLATTPNTRTNNGEFGNWKQQKLFEEK